MFGQRLTWSALPERVRDWVETELGAPVVEALSQPAGFSPGTADRVVTAHGHRAFVKAVSPDQNPDTPALHRREIAVLQTLREVASVPALQAWFDDGHWVVLIIEDVEGHHPLPWTSAYLDGSLQALRILGQSRAPTSWPRLEEELVAEMACWSRLREDLPGDLDPWARSRIEELDGLSQNTLPRMAGDAVSHTDVRSDNLLIASDGAVRVVDWPWASRGAPWCDLAMLLVNVRLDGDLDVRPHLPAIYDLGASHQDVCGLIAGLSGFFIEAGRRPDAPGLPTLRDFQRRQGQAGIALLQELW